MDIEGSWALRSIVVDGEPRPGRHGLLIYAADGYMAAAINESDDAPAPSAEPPLLYAGTWELEGSEVVHHVSNCSEPDRIGRSLRRRASLSGDGRWLTLVAEGRFGQAVLEWERAPSRVADGTASDR